MTTKSTKKSKTVVAKKEIIDLVSQPTPQNEVQLLISQAVENKVPVETLEKLLDLRDRVKIEQGKEAFDIDMSVFQGECPIINKTKIVKDNRGNELYKYAPLDQIVRQVKALLTKCNFSYSIKTETNEKNVKATCIARHRLGHKEESSMEVPLGTKTAIMSQTQVVASALTFAKRYSFCDVFGIMTGEDDEEKVLLEEPKKDATNYLDLLKMALYKKGAKNPTDALNVFNDVTGRNIKALPKINNDVALELYSDFINYNKSK